MKYNIIYSKDYKKAIKIEEVIDTLANGQTLEPRFKDHKLKGEYKDFRECHIKPDLLLIYQKQDDILVLLCLAIGSHSELF